MLLDPHLTCMLTTVSAQAENPSELHFRTLHHIQAFEVDEHSLAPWFKTMLFS